MKIHSIQFRILMTVLSSMLAITFFIGALSLYEVDSFIQSQTDNLLHATCKREAAQINDIFGDMEKSVRIMESFVLDLVESKADIEDIDKQNEVLKRADEMFSTIAKNTNGAVGYYLRFDPEISDYKTGLFYTKVDGSNVYTRLESTDLSLYDKDDTAHVGWFWQPYEAQKPIWMNPYYNLNNGILMISYVIPMYCENQFIGIVGMDFDYTVLVDQVREIRIYENGFAYLKNDNNIISYNDNDPLVNHADMSEKYVQVSEKLVNGMTLVLSASLYDINQIRYTIACKILFAALSLVIVFSFIAVVVVRRIVRPLKTLISASKELSDGNYDVKIDHSEIYEIKLLSTAFENMIVHLREHKKLQQRLAYRDSLTGLRNTTAYKEWISDFDQELKNRNTAFGVIVFDLNYLKETNDMFGHDAGNMLIIAASKVIADTFKRSPVFRIGGDEFLAILQNNDLENCKTLLIEFDRKCAAKSIKSAQTEIAVSVAKGFAKYDSTTDTKFLDVFKRADQAMYANKKNMKSSSANKFAYRSMV